MTEKQRWQKMAKRDTAAFESLLRSRERCCMNACSRYLHRDPAKDHLWTLRDTGGAVSAIIICSKRNLLLVLSGQTAIPPPHFLRGLFGVVPVHSLQGLQSDAVILEQALEKSGLKARETIDYDIMCIDKSPVESCLASGPPGLVIRRPEFAEMDALAALQAAYEQEEVLPLGSTFNPAASRMNMERILAHEHVFVAEVGGTLVGKINTSAASFTRFQVGGVYVHPRFRGMGVARRMAAEFVRFLVAQGRGISLFVKKSNSAARRVYCHLGFEFQGNYRISYY